MLIGPTRDALREALDVAFMQEADGDEGHASCYPWLIDFDPTQQFLIAEIPQPGEPTSRGLFKIPYTQAEDGSIALGEPVAVEQKYVVKGTNTIVASAVVGEPGTELLADILGANYAGTLGTPNGAPFVADLTILDTPSQHIGTKIQLTTAGAQAAMGSLAGKPVHVTADLAGHYEAGRPFTPVGVMLGGKITTNGAGQPVVRVAGLLWESDFPGAVGQIRAAKNILGASWEIEYDPATVTRLSPETIELAGWTYRGAAILLKHAAAYPGTALLHAESGDAATLTTKRRNTLEDADFAVVVKTKSGATERKLPIHDEAHRKAAWSRVHQEQTDLTPAQRSIARDRIMNKAKRAGDDWAKGYTKSGGSWVKKAQAAGKGIVMATKYASYSLPEGVDESVIDKIVGDAIGRLESGREVEALRTKLATADTEGAATKQQLTEATSQASTAAQKAAAAEAKVAELTTQVTALQAETTALQAEKARIEAREKAATWWLAFAKAQGLTHLSQAEIDQRWPIIEKAALDQGLTMAEHEQLLAGRRAPTVSGREIPEHAPRSAAPPLGAAFADASGTQDGVTRESLVKLLPNLGRALTGKNTLR